MSDEKLLPAKEAPKESMSDLLGNVLLVKRDGKVEQTGISHLDGKHVGLYFSAHWCPPCRQFTPLLRATYEKLHGKPFEIVFVSRDNKESEFQDYYGGMPWAALPFQAQDVSTKLMRKFQVYGIPTFVMLDPSGNVLNTNARGAVLADPSGEKFPWQGAPEAASPDIGRLVLLLVVAVMIYLFFYSK